jgi:BirA family biotin operon repressor/biotin-[acetyl-CoA-carboxylase] ligase
MNVKQLRTVLSSKFFGKEIIYFETIDSTNTFAKKLAEEGKADGTIVIADEQTKGRGRFARSWISDKEKNLTFSIILRPKISIERIGLLPFVFATAITKTLKDNYQINAETKWPNDILLNGKKLCGMLLESSFHSERIDYIIVGIGLNVNQETFPDELQQTATSLYIETEHERNREELLSNILLQCEKEYVSFCGNESNEILAEWKTFSSMFGKEISVRKNGNVLNGIAMDISSGGELLVNVNDNVMKFNSGDVTIVHN